MKEKQIQIDKSVFIDLYILVNGIKQGYEIDVERLCRVDQAIENKIASLLKREAFTRYKKAEPTSEERERFRKEYLKSADIHENWQSTHEVQI